MTGVVFAFGRLNPPTIGHSKLVEVMVTTARNSGSDHCLFLSQTYNSVTDPLDWNLKRRIATAAFPGVKISSNTDIRTPFQALELLAENYSRIELVVGSDQEELLAHRMQDYCQRMSIPFAYHIAGQRLAEGSREETISSTQMREYARLGDQKSFYQGLPTTLKPALKEFVYCRTRSALKIDD